MVDPAPTSSEDPGDAARDPKPGFEAGIPRIVRFLALNLGVGVGLGMVFAALILLGNVGGLKTLIAEAAEPWLAVFLLYFMCSLTFGSLAMGAAVMTLPYPEPAPEDGEDNGLSR